MWCPYADEAAYLHPNVCRVYDAAEMDGITSYSGDFEPMIKKE